MMRARGEIALVAWLRQNLDAGIGDDAAFVPGGRELAYTIDTQQEGVHFPSGIDPAVVASRLLAVNLSDLAAVGAKPRYALLSLASPRDWNRRRFFSALRRAADSWRMRVVGGDLSRGDRVHAVLCAIGERSAHGRFLHRSSAEPGQLVWLGGRVGVSALGLALQGRSHVPGQLPEDLPADLTDAATTALRHHLRPEPQLELGRWLARRRSSSPAAIDVSDGLGIDLGRLASASDVGIEIALPQDALPHPALCSWLGLDPLEIAIAGGEDYVLAFTLPERLRPPPEFHCLRIGCTVEGRGVRLLLDGRQSRDISTSGHDHLL